MVGKMLLVYYTQNNPPLGKLPAEVDALWKVCSSSKVCLPERCPDTDPADIIHQLEDYPQDYRIFHFAGHALDEVLEMGQDKLPDNARQVDMAYYADQLARYGTDLRLVFLNACGTEKQAKALLKEGIRAVVATTLPVRDTYAAEFARHFYTLFLTKGYTLSEAVQEAHTRLNQEVGNQLVNRVTGKLNEKLLVAEEHRGGFVLHRGALPDPEQIFKIYTRQQEHAEARYTDWQTDASTPPQQIDLERSGPFPPRIDPEAYLICDRDDQEAEFCELTQAQTEPRFLFIHDPAPNSPFELAQRFKFFSIRDVCDPKITIRIEPLDFPTRFDFKNANDPEKARHHLANEYSRKFSRPGGNPYNEALGRYEYPRLGANVVAIAHHQIPLDFWEDRIRDYFLYYLDEFSTLLRDTLSERLLVICSFVHTDDQDEIEVAGLYQKLFDELSADARFKGRIAHFFNLDKIKKSHLARWYNKVSQESLSKEQDEALPAKTDFRDAIDIMKKLIAAYNESR